MKNKIEYYLLKFFVWIVSFLPNSAVYKILKFIAKLCFRFEKRRSSLTQKNLKLAFADLKDEEIVQLAKKSYESLAITIAEIVLMINDKLDIDSMIVNNDEAKELLDRYTKDSKNGVIIITAHFSNWELAAQSLPRNGYPMTAIGRRGNNRLIEDNFTTPFRERFGNKNIYKKDAMLNIVKTLRRNGTAGLLIDQKARGASSIKVNFFGKPAITTTSIATLKLKYDSLILPIFMPRQSDGRYKLVVCEAVEYRADEECDKNKKIEKMTQKYNDIIEKIVKEYPEQWFWMHNRWKAS